MPPEFQPSSEDLALYLEQRGELSKPWNLQMLRLQKLKEAKGTMEPEEYMAKVQEAHADLMRLGQFWKGREAEVFGGVYQPPNSWNPDPDHRRIADADRISRDVHRGALRALAVDPLHPDQSLCGSCLAVTSAGACGSAGLDERWPGAGPGAGAGPA